MYTVWERDPIDISLSLSGFCGARIVCMMQQSCTENLERKLFQIPSHRAISTQIHGDNNTGLLTEICIPSFGITRGARLGFQEPHTRQKLRPVYIISRVSNDILQAGHWAKFEANGMYVKLENAAPRKFSARLAKSARAHWETYYLIVL